MRSPWTIFEAIDRRQTQGSCITDPRAKEPLDTCSFSSRSVGASLDSLRAFPLPPSMVELGPNDMSLLAAACRQAGGLECVLKGTDV